MIKVRNKNAILELLEAEAEFDSILLAKGLKKDRLTEKIVSLAHKNQIPIREVPRNRMEKRRGGETNEAVLGIVRTPPVWSLESLLDYLYEKGQEPFFLLVNKVGFESNLGVIARTAYAAGVNGLFFQGDEDLYFNEEVVHYSLGTIIRIPAVKMSIFDALDKFKENGIKIFSLDMRGKPYYKEKLTGPAAFVLGAEREGLSSHIKERSDSVISIPMKNGIDSMNVATSAAVILFERNRQNG